MHCHFILYFVICLFLKLELSALADRYQLIDLGVLKKDSSEMHSINNKGEICGVYTEGRSSYAYIWSKNDSNYKFFKSPYRIFITNSSIVYGSYFDWVPRGTWNVDQETIYRWESPFSYVTWFNCKDIGYPSALFSTGGNLFTVALWDVNDQDQLLVMDDWVINRSYNYQIWVHDKGKFNQINHPQLNAAIRINNDSQILGYYFENLFSSDGESLGTKGRKTVIYDLKTNQATLFNIPGETWGEDINDLGEVAGTIKEKENVIGFFGTPDHLVKIENFSPAALNNSGQLIGKMIDHPNKNAPAIWENGNLTLMSELMTLIDDKGNEWQRIDSLRDINDSGEIVGQGVCGDKPHGFLLIPGELGHFRNRDAEREN